MSGWKGALEGPGDGPAQRSAAQRKLVHAQEWAELAIDGQRHVRPVDDLHLVVLRGLFPLLDGPEGVHEHVGAIVCRGGKALGSLKHPGNSPQMGAEEAGKGGLLWRCVGLRRSPESAAKELAEAACWGEVAPGQAELAHLCAPRLGCRCGS